MSVYKVQWNSCDCHPETCCCDPFVVHRPDGTKHSTFADRETAKTVADLLNMAAAPSSAADEGSNK